MAKTLKEALETPAYLVGHDARKPRKLLTAGERAIRHGNHDTKAAHDSYQLELIRRLDAGEYLTKSDRALARRLKRASLRCCV